MLLILFILCCIGLVFFIITRDLIGVMLTAAGIFLFSVIASEHAGNISKLDIECRNKNGTLVAYQTCVSNTIIIPLTR